jgi:hypothetical protein
MQGLVVVNNPDYVPQAWHGYLFNVMLARTAVLVLKESFSSSSPWHFWLIWWYFGCLLQGCRIVSGRSTGNAGGWYG